MLIGEEYVSLSEFAKAFEEQALELATEKRGAFAIQEAKDFAFRCGLALTRLKTK